MSHVTRRETLEVLLAASAAAFARDARAADERVRVTFLLVNDFYRITQNKDKRGGFARLATVVNTERAQAKTEGRRLFVVHAGDTLSPSPLSSLESGAHMIALFNDLGLDAFVPGNHEFDFGKETYLERMAEAKFPILAANLTDPNGARPPRHEARLLVDVGGVTIALIGSAYDETPTASRPGDLVFGRTTPTIGQEAKRARAAGADLVVAIVHADKATCARLMNAHVVDLILSGHNHDLHIDFDGRTAWIESQADAYFLNRIDLDLAIATGDKARRVSWWPTFRPIDTATVVPDPGFGEKVGVYEERLAKLYDIEIATLATPLDSRTEIVRTEEAAIGNLFADALRKATAAEVALVNGGGIRGNRLYPVGAKLTRRDIAEELPFDNKTIVAPVTGKTILAALENGVSQLDRASGRFLQVSGLGMIVDRTAASGKVKSASIRGEPIDPDRRYLLATNDFLARGGDGYGMLAAEVKAGVDSGTRLVAQDVASYVEALKIIEAKVEGRIVFE